MNDLIFSRCMPELHVSSLERAREQFALLGCEIESGSGTHAVMTLNRHTAVRLVLDIPAVTAETTGNPRPHRDPEAKLGVTVVVEVAGKSGLQAYHATLKTRGMAVTDISAVGWGKRKFTVSMEDGHRLTFVQEKEVYQG